MCQCGWRYVTTGRTHASVSVWMEMCDWREDTYQCVSVVGDV